MFTMTDSMLKPQFFVTRQNDTMVPLIALDEMPDHIIIKGLSRTLTPREIQGMTCIGAFDIRHQKHCVINLNQSPQTTLGAKCLLDSIDFFAEEDSLVDRKHSRPTGSNSSKAENANQQANSMRRHLTVSHTIESTVDNDGVVKPNKVKEGPIQCLTGGKEYCSYWLRTGSCDFTQQGCLYKHEMPLDLPTLERLGHRDIPKWYREKYGHGSHLAAKGSVASFSVLKTNVARSKLPRNGRHVCTGTEAVRVHNNIGARSKLNCGRNSRIQSPSSIERMVSVSSSNSRSSSIKPSNKQYSHQASAVGVTEMNTSKSSSQQSETESTSEDAASDLLSSSPSPPSSSTTTCRTMDLCVRKDKTSRGLMSSIYASPQRRTSSSTVLSDIEMEYIQENAERRAAEEREDIHDLLKFEEEEAQIPTPKIYKRVGTAKKLEVEKQGMVRQQLETSVEGGVLKSKGEQGVIHKKSKYRKGKPSYGSNAISKKGKTQNSGRQCIASKSD